MDHGYRKLVIIGAPRTGTNMLRDVLTGLDRIETWPCDEINYIWRHGNRAHPSDAFSADMASERVRAYVRGRFDAMARSSDAEWLIEKTCANSLRVPFVDRVVPDAVYIHIVRDGVDAVASAMKRWTADLDVPYLLKKARFVPWSDVPYYLLRYVSSRLHRMRSSEKRLSVWGPKLDRMPERIEGLGLEEICALQWRACVDASSRAFESIAPDRVHHVRYEEFVADPVGGVARLAAALGFERSAEAYAGVAGSVFAGSVGKGRRKLTPDQLERVRAIAGDTLDELGYRI